MRAGRTSPETSRSSIPGRIPRSCNSADRGKAKVADHDAVRAGPRRAWIAARKALAAAGDPREELIEKQLARRELENANDYSSPRSCQLRTDIDALIAAHGRAWAVHRGVVAQVRVSGETWVRLATELMALALIQHLDLCEPLGDLGAVFVVPEVARLVTLSVSMLDAAFGDRGAIALARSPKVPGLRWIDLCRNAIGEAGVEAIAASPYLEYARFIAFDSNPCDPTPVVYDYDLVRTASRPPVAAELERTYGARPWLALTDEDPRPPRRDEVATTA